jgi:hypothetical protein
MPTYRVQVMVGVDVEAESPQEAFGEAINKVRTELGEDPLAPHPKPAWVNGVVQCDPAVSGHTAVEGYMIFETTAS